MRKSAICLFCVVMHIGPNADAAEGIQFPVTDIPASMARIQSADSRSASEAVDSLIRSGDAQHEAIKRVFAAERLGWHYVLPVSNMEWGVESVITLDSWSMKLRCSVDPMDTLIASFLLLPGDAKYQSVPEQFKPLSEGANSETLDNKLNYLVRHYPGRTLPVVREAGIFGEGGKSYQPAGTKSISIAKLGVCSVLRAALQYSELGINGYHLSENELAENERLAKAGDLNAGRILIQYFEWGDGSLNGNGESQATFWLSFVANEGDGPARDVLIARQYLAFARGDVAAFNWMQDAAKKNWPKAARLVEQMRQNGPGKLLVSPSEQTPP